MARGLQLANALTNGEVKEMENESHLMDPSIHVVEGLSLEKAKERL